jgi:hypothetical protein
MDIFTCENFDLTRQIVGTAELNVKGRPVLGRPYVSSDCISKLDNESLLSCFHKGVNDSFTPIILT